METLKQKVENLLNVFNIRKRSLIRKLRGDKIATKRNAIITVCQGALETCACSVAPKVITALDVAVILSEER